MQRWCASAAKKLGAAAAALSLLKATPKPNSTLSHPSSSLTRFFHSTSSFTRPLFHGPTTSLVTSSNGFSPSTFSLSLMQMRSFSATAKEKKWKKLTPTISKVKKYKMKGYSSFKQRFKLLNDGTIRRWRAGKRHNASSKSKISKRRLRKPEIVHLAYAKVMKKLNFCS